MKKSMIMIFLQIVIIFFFKIEKVQSFPILTEKSIPVNGIFAVPKGSHSFVNSDGKTVIITKNINSQVGSIFSTESNKIDLKSDFTATMKIYLGDSFNLAADGAVFVMHNDPNQLIGFYGGLGSQLGVYDILYSRGLSANGPQMKKSFAIEFDTYRNFEQIPGRGIGLDGETLRNGDKGHIAYTFPDQESSYNMRDRRIETLNHNAIYYPGDSLSNGKWHDFEINWNSVTSVLSYKFDDAPIVHAPIDVQKTFGTNEVYWGFTGSTGGQTQESTVVFTKVPGLVNLENSFEVFDNMKTLVENKEINDEEIMNVSLKVKYLSGKQSLLNPKIIFDLGKNLKYKVGTLKYNGKKIEDSGWNGATYSQAIDTLSLANLNGDLSFDIEPYNNEGFSNNPVSVSYKIEADNYISDVEKYNFFLKKNPIMITLNQPLLYINPSDVERYNLSDNNEILMELIRKSGAEAKDLRTNLAEGVNIKPNDLNVYDKIKGFKNGYIDVEIVAEKNTELSNPRLLRLIWKEGGLEFESVPKSISFNEVISNSSDKKFLASPDTDLIITDTRISGSFWVVKASATELKTADGRVLEGELNYLNSNGEIIIINSDVNNIQTGIKFRGNSINISSDWQDNIGLLFKTNNANYVGKYSGVINWSLSDAP